MKRLITTLLNCLALLVGGCSGSGQGGGSLCVQEAKHRINCDTSMTDDMRNFFLLFVGSICQDQETTELSLTLPECRYDEYVACIMALPCDDLGTAAEDQCWAIRYTPECTAAVDAETLAARGPCPYGAEFACEPERCEQAGVVCGDGLCSSSMNLTIEGVDCCFCDEDSFPPAWFVCERDCPTQIYRECDFSVCGSVCGDGVCEEFVPGHFQDNEDYCDCPRESCRTCPSDCDAELGCAWVCDQDELETCANVCSDEAGLDCGLECETETFSSPTVAGWCDGTFTSTPPSGSAPRIERGSATSRRSY